MDANDGVLGWEDLDDDVMLLLRSLLGVEPTIRPKSCEPERDDCAVIDPTAWPQS